MTDGTRSDYPFERKIPDGDNRPRMVCRDCGWIHYDNPKIVVGSVCTWKDRLLLCRRSIEPRRGYWTIPAGFLEEHESTEAGAEREALEEACARLEIDGLLGIYNIPRISQVQLLYRARLLAPDVAPGDETLEVGLFHFDEIPWDLLAFPSIGWALRCFDRVRDQPTFAPFTHTVAPDSNPGPPSRD